MSHRISILGGLLVLAFLSLPSFGLAQSGSDWSENHWPLLAQTRITPLDNNALPDAVDAVDSPVADVAADPVAAVPVEGVSGDAGVSAPSALPAPLTKKAAKAQSAQPKAKTKTVAQKQPPKTPRQSATPAAAQTESPAKQNLAVRVGSHPGFVRLVFDWATITDYTLRKEANAVYINFTRNATVNLEPIYAALPPAIGVFETGVESNNLVVAFTIPQGARIRDSKFGHLIIVDVMTPDKSVAQKIKTRLLPPITIDPKLEVKNRPAPPPPPPPQSQPQPQSMSDQTPPKPIAAIPAEVYSQPLGSDPTIAGPSLLQTDGINPEVTVFRLVTPDMTSLRFIFPLETGLAAFERGEFLYVIFDRQARFNFSALGKDAPPNWMTPQRLGPNPAADARRSSDLSNAPLSQKPEANGTAQPLAAGIPEAIALDIGSGIRLRIPKGWQVQISKPLYPAPTASGSGKSPAQTPGIAATSNQFWAVDFVRTPLRHSDLRVTNDVGNGDSGKKPRTAFQIATVGARSVIAVSVPELDRPLQVVPLSMVARGIMTNRHYPQFILASSWQGVVVEPITDGVRVSAKGDHVLVEAAAGAAFKVQNLPINSLYDFSSLVKKDSDYNPQRQRLQQLVVESSGDEKNRNRFNLAQFFIANNHAADALGILDILSREMGREKSNSPSLGNDPAVKALRGLARVMMNDGKAAILDLTDSRLNGIPAIGWWRGAALAIEEDYRSADQAFVAAGEIPAGYPTEIKAMLLQYAAESAFGIGKVERARSLFFGFPVGVKNPSLSNRVDYLKAQLLLSKNDEVDDKLALSILDWLAKDGNAWGRAHGEWARIQFYLKKGQLPVDQAIIRLERLQYSWSGSEMQFRVLAQLGDLYFDQLQPREGLKRLRQAVQYFPYHPDRETVKAHLIDRFVGLYSDKGSERIPPLAALAVYDDNRDLTPLDERGDLMIQKLADRLVEIDLLDRAADLLTYQVQQRLKGSERSRVGARLAAIQLLDKKPQEALISLDLSDVPNVGSDLRKQRQLLQSRALLKSAKPELALRALDGITDRDADQVRAEIFADGKQWTRLAEVMARLVGQPVPGVMLDDGQQQLLLNLAVALVMAGDNGSVRKLNSDFIGLIPDGDAKNTFIVLTSGDGLVGGTDAAALNLRFSELGQFKQAMNSLARITEVKK